MIPFGTRVGNCGGAALAVENSAPLRPPPLRSGEHPFRSISSGSPHKICGFCGGKTGTADKPIFRIYDGYYRQLNFSV